MTDNGDDDAVRMELGSDAWHQDEDGQFYIDCPECGSAATLSNIVNHGRCNGYMDQQQSDTELDEQAMPCSASLSLDLVYASDPDESMADPEVGDEETETGDVDFDEQASGTDSAPSND